MHLDLSRFRAAGGLQPGEEPMPAAGDTTSSSGGGGGGGGAGAAGSAGAAAAIDEEVVSQLMAMGFSENGCRRAAKATAGSNAEIAMGWIFEHMEDPDFNDPMDTAAAESSSPAAAAASAGSQWLEEMSMIMSMGYTNDQALAALKATDGNLER